MSVKETISGVIEEQDMIITLETPELIYAKKIDVKPKPKAFDPKHKLLN